MVCQDSFSVETCQWRMQLRFAMGWCPVGTCRSQLRLQKLHQQRLAWIEYDYYNIHCIFSGICFLIWAVGAAVPFLNYWHSWLQRLESKLPDFIDCLAMLAAPIETRTAIHLEFLRDNFAQFSKEKKCKRNEFESNNELLIIDHHWRAVFKWLNRKLNMIM